MAVLAQLDPAVRGMLAEDLPAQLREVRRLLDTEALHAAAGIVHTVAGSAAYCQLGELHAASLSLENALLQKADTTALAAAFYREVDNVLRMLESDQN